MRPWEILRRGVKCTIQLAVAAESRASVVVGRRRFLFVTYAFCANGATARPPRPLEEPMGYPLRRCKASVRVATLGVKLRVMVPSGIRRRTK